METEGRPERLERLRLKLASVPQLPGVYLHKDGNGKILYVGKAKSLRARLKSYFSGLDRHTLKTRALVSKIEEYEYIVVDNENESLILENNLIKHHKPPYNILLRDDKTFPYLRVHLKEDWPRVTKTRRRKNDGALYFGPYTNGAQLESLLSIINRFFPLVKCQPSVFKRVQRPCNYYDIKKCLGPCKLPVAREEYMKFVNTVVAILRGKTGDVSKELKKEMMNASEEMAFEKAASLRDQIKALEGLGEHQSVALMPGLYVDVLGQYHHGDTLCFHVAMIRDGQLLGGENVIVKQGLEEPVDFGDDGVQQRQNKTLATFLCQYYSRREVPPHLLVTLEGDDMDEETKKAIRLFLGGVDKETKAHEREVEIHGTTSGLIRSLGLQKTEKSLAESFEAILAKCHENARTRFQEELQVDEKSRAMMLGLQTFLQLEKLPVWIECFDISTFQGTSTVASQVVSKEGKLARGEYRSYVIKGVPGQDDFAALREVMRRRFHEKSREDLPDLLLIDGGEPQVREVGRVLKSLGLQGVLFVGIAKARTERSFASTAIRASAERLVIPVRRGGELFPEETPRTLFLRPASNEYRLVTQLRDEAHRFAITHHRKRRDKVSSQSILSEISGLGPKRRKKILEVFSTFDALRKATVEEIAEKSGIPIGVAKKVKSVLAQEQGNVASS